MEFGAAKGAAHAERAGRHPVPAPPISSHFAARSRAGATIAVAASKGELITPWRCGWSRCATICRRALVVEDERKVSAFIGQHANVIVDWPIKPYDPFFNVNRPEDLAHARCDSQGRVAQLN
jgi:molybdopterin-guanine dinucleotide biosynthesis protein A